MGSKENTRITFGEFELDEGRRLLLKQGKTVNMNPKALDLLLVFLKNHGQLLSKEELLDTVWENQFVEENNLTVHISALRKIFGEKKGEHQFIVTIPGKGYKFVADIHLAGDEIITLKLPSTPQTNYAIAPAALLEESESDESFIGRNQEITDIKNLLRQRNINLVTLTGAGGTGKTRLAQFVSKELKADFPDGVFFVELAATNDAEFVISVIAQTLDVTESAGKSPIESVTDFLRERRILLVLDNFEHLLSAASLVKELLSNVFSLKILVTSRAPLRLNIEREFKVMPLEFPTADSAVSINQVTEFSAIKLFCKRAQSVKPTFLLSDENFPVVTEICRRLDGLPLAIELAAARVRLFSPQAILDRLENSLKLLTGGTKDSPARQRTMRDAIQWSYDLLEENEKFLFRRLAIFAGGFTVEAAEAVAEGEKEIQVSNTTSTSPRLRVSASVLDTLDSLIDNNLLVSREQSGGNVRLRMLEVVREFAFEILTETGELDELQRFQAAYFLSLAEKAEPLLHGEDGNEWLERLETEYDNLRSALSWSLKNDGETATRIAAGLRFFWLNRSYLSEGLRWSSAALQATENSVSKARSDLLLSNGVFLRSQGNLAAARKSYEKTLAESRQINDSLQIIKANHGLAAIAVLEKDFDSAQGFIGESLALSRELNDEMQTAYSLGSLGDLEMSRENLSAARPLLEDCLRLSKKLAHKKLLTVTYFNLGTIDYLEGSYQTAAFNFAESLQIAKKMGNVTMISCAVEGFAALAVKNGNPQQSAKLAGAADSLRESIGYQIEPAEEIFRNKYLTKTRADLSEKQFAALYEQGKAMSFDETVDSLIRRNAIKNDSTEMSEITIETHSIERIIIEEIEDESPNEIVIHPVRQITSPSAKSFKSIAYAVLGLILSALVLGFWFFNGKSTSEPAPFKFTRLTSSGKIINATMTRDGSYAVFSQTEKDGESLWLKHIATGSQNQILKSKPVNFVGLTTSPDGNFIYATVFSGDLSDPQVWRIPRLGGAVEHIQNITTGATVTLSPDGKRMAFTESRSSLKETHLVISDANGTNKKILVRAKDDERSFPNFKASPVAWSPNGSEIACVVERKTTDSARKAAILLINADDGSEKFLTEKHWDYVDNISWIDEENLALSASAMNQGQIWTVSKTSGEVRQITTDLNSYSWVAGGGNSILTVQKNIVSKVSIAEFDEKAQILESREVFAESGYISYVNWTADGKILYSSTAGGQPEIWRITPDGADKTQLTVNAYVEFGLSVSPTDGSLLFCLSKDGKHSLHLTDSEGKNMRRLIEGTEDVWGNFTPDGRSVIFQRGLNNKTLTLWQFNLADGKLSQLTQTNSIFPTVSPDGTQTAFYFMDAKTDNLWRIGLISTATGEFSGKINLPKEATERRMRWHPNGKFISQIAKQGEQIKLLLLPLDGNNPTQTFDLGKGDLQWFEWKHDGKKIVVSQSTETQDALLLNDF